MLKNPYVTGESNSQQHYNVPMLDYCKETVITKIKYLRPVHTRPEWITIRSGQRASTLHFENDTSTSFRYHVTDDRCVCVVSLLVESVDTATKGEREQRRVRSARCSDYTRSVREGNAHYF